MAPHEEFLELCAVSLSGELTADERRRLYEHLQGCPACREALAQFKASVEATAPVAAEQSKCEEPDPSFSVENAEAAFFSRFDREGGFDGFDSPEQREHAVAQAFGATNHGHGVGNGAGWGQLWMPFVAILLLCVALGVASYRIGMKRGVETASLASPVDRAQVGLEARLTDAGRERQELIAQIAGRDQTIAELRKQIQEQSATQRQRAVTSNDQNNAAPQGLAANTARLEALQKQLEAEQQARSQDTARETELEAKVADLSKQLQESGLTITQQRRQLDEKESAFNQERDLLEHDRDIRDLMGARQLHVVDVYDVGGAGTNKPYGRVFYTQGKSLIFYAYDLDQAPGVKRASTFQAWGRRGPNKDRALNLGVFYEDNAANKRWVVKFDDPKSLAHIDGVFVTVEPDAHSNTPRGKQVLFAYLNVDPNHP
jgi:hypothetical protein